MEGTFNRAAAALLLALMLLVTCQLAKITPSSPTASPPADASGQPQPSAPAATEESTSAPPPSTRKDDDDQDKDRGNGWCADSSRRHPAAARLAEQFDVPYEDIADWACQGHGIGEIRRAYTWSTRTALPVADIFALRAQGMGWGRIKKKLESRRSD